MTPLVSIIIPCYNASRWIDDALSSALSQTWPRCEVIAIDDGSTDDSLERLQRFASKGVVVLSQPNRGAAAARNVGLAAAHGDYVQFLDADDLLSRDKIELQIVALSGSPNTLASCSWGRFTSNPEESTFVPEAVWTDADPITWLVTSAIGGGMMHPAAWLVPRDVLLRSGHWDERLSLNDDGEFFTRVLVSSSRVTFVAKARTHYRSAIATSLSKQRTDAAWESALLAAQLSTSRLLDAERTPRTTRAAADIFTRFSYDAYIYRRDLSNIAQKAALELGGSPLPPPGGPLFRVLARAVGWKLAMRAKAGAYELGYRANSLRASASC
jgi:glycosyltransferase involved in cell wall biosynthesis